MLCGLDAASAKYLIVVIIFLMIIGTVHVKILFAAVRVLLFYILDSFHSCSSFSRLQFDIERLAALALSSQAIFSLYLSQYS